MSTASGEINKDNFSLSVKVPGGQVISIDASPEMLVSDLKQSIAQMTKHPVATQVLHLGKLRLCNKVQLFTYLSGESPVVLSVLSMDPDKIVRQLIAGTFDLELVSLSSSSSYPKDIFLDVSDIDKLSAYCVVCKEIPRNAMELDCDKCMGVICKNCLKKAKESATPGEVKCLTDNCENHIDLHKSNKNRAITKLIRQQKVKCTSTLTFNDKQCEWIGTTVELDNHTAVCSFQRVNCPFWCDSVVCKKFATLDGHFAECPKFFLSCRHCLEFYPRQEMIDHEAKCSEELLQCTFNCGKELPKRDIEKHNCDSLIIHVQCLKKELDSERKIRLVIEREMGCIKNQLDSEIKKRAVMEDELKELRKIMLPIVREREQKEKEQKEKEQKEKEQKEREAPGFFCSNNTTSGFTITENGKRVSGSGTGTAGCSKVLSSGKCVFKLKFLQYTDAYCMGFFPTSVGKPGNVFIGYNDFPGYGYSGHSLCGKDSNSGFKGLSPKVGDIITAILDLDNGTISYVHNGNDLGVAFKNIRGSYRACVCSWNNNQFTALIL